MLSTTHPHGRALPGYAYNHQRPSRLGLLRSSPALTGLLSAVLVAGFSLAGPTPASARTNGGERALLDNTQAVAPIAAFRGAPYQSAAGDPRFSAGERALLGKSSHASSLARLVTFSRSSPREAPLAAKRRFSVRGSGPRQ